MIPVRRSLFLLVALLATGSAAAAAEDRQLICRVGGQLEAVLEAGTAGRLPLLTIDVAGEPYDQLERLPSGHCMLDGLGLRAADPRRILLLAEGPLLMPPSSPGGLDAEVARDAAFQALLRLLESGEGWFAAIVVEEAGAWRARRAFPCDQHACD